MRIVVPWGFYGWGNIGDEGTLNGFARLLACTGVRASVEVGSRNPAHTAAVEPSFRYFDSSRRDPRRWMAKWRASNYVFAGGTPITDVLGDWPLRDVVPLVRTAVQRQLPVVFIGVGIEQLRHDTSLDVIAEEVAPHARQWTVRSAKDASRLISYGVSADRVTIAADMAWLMDQADGEFGRRLLCELGVDPERPLIGVNLVNENGCFERQPQLGSEIARALDALVDQLGAQVVFLAQEVRDDPQFDGAAASGVAGRMKWRSRVKYIPNRYFSPAQVLSILEHCDLTLGMRYHFCIFSAIQHVPFVAIQRSDKVADLCWDLGWTAGVGLDGVTAASLLTHSMELIRDPSIRNRMKTSVERMRDRALKNGICVEALVETSGRERVAAGAGC
jgi:polysaccharide pyruvyl transferase WcaK-like protein